MAKKQTSKLTPSKESTSPKENFRFSFEFYDTTSSEFCLSTWKDSDIKRTLSCLQDICRKSFFDLKAESRVYHFHEVEWKGSAKPDGFPTEALNDLDPYQFSLVGVNQQKARVFGAYALGTFYIVWFDLNHQITPSFLKNT